MSDAAGDVRATLPGTWGRNALLTTSHEGSNMKQYAKALVGIAGAAVTAALGIVPPSSPTWSLLTVLAAAITAAGVYLVPNGK